MNGLKTNGAPSELKLHVPCGAESRHTSIRTDGTVGTVLWRRDKTFMRILGVALILCPVLAISLLLNQLAFAFIDRRVLASVPPPIPGASIEITPELLEAIIQIESENKPRAYNRRTKARGLTQITPITWKEIRKHLRRKYANLNYYKDIYHPEIAREAGRDYLYILQKLLRAKSIPLTLDNLLAAYVWGPGNLSKYGLNRAPRVVKRYISRVKRLAQIPL